MNMNWFMAGRGHKYINITHLVVLSPSGHPWSWVRWSGCSLGSGGGPPACRWCPAPGAPSAWGVGPWDCETILKSPGQSTSPGLLGAQSPSQTRRLLHAERRVNRITIRQRYKQSPFGGQRSFTRATFLWLPVKHFYRADTKHDKRRISA